VAVESVERVSADTDALAHVVAKGPAAAVVAPRSSAATAQRVRTPVVIDVRRELSARLPRSVRW
jgi:hypothetical protein